MVLLVSCGRLVRLWRWFVFIIFRRVCRLCSHIHRLTRRFFAPVRAFRPVVVCLCTDNRLSRRLFTAVTVRSLRPVTTIRRFTVWTHINVTGFVLLVGAFKILAFWLNLKKCTQYKVTCGDCRPAILCVWCLEWLQCRVCGVATHFCSQTISFLLIRAGQRDTQQSNEGTGEDGNVLRVAHKQSLDYRNHESVSPDWYTRGVPLGLWSLCR